MELNQEEGTDLNQRFIQEHYESTRQGEPALPGESQEALSPVSLRNWHTRRLAPSADAVVAPASPREVACDHSFWAGR